MRLRQAARGVVLDPAERILLVRFEFPARTVWAAPGGGLEPGETHGHALVRELREEAGLEVIEIGPWIWSRTHVIPFLDGSADGQVERYFLLRTPAFEPVPVFTMEQLESEYVTAIRWWTHEELAASEEQFAPRRLPELVAALLRDGPPGEPIDVGV
jgi:ADP-ribose pyrophosphatase YjhB (NUDIX family)